MNHRRTWACLFNPYFDDVQHWLPVVVIRWFARSTQISLVAPGPLKYCPFTVFAVRSLARTAGNFHFYCCNLLVISEFVKLIYDPGIGVFLCFVQTQNTFWSILVSQEWILFFVTQDFRERIQNFKIVKI